MKIYMLHIEMFDGSVEIAKDIYDKVVVAEEENISELCKLGELYLSKGEILAYQIVCAENYPVRTYSSMSNNVYVQ